MRLIRNLTGTLLVASMASLVYAWAPAHATAGRAGETINNPDAPYAAQQDEAKPPKQDESKPSKETKEARPPAAHKQQVRPKQQEKPSKEQKTQKEQMKQASRDQGQRRASAGQSQQARKNHGQPAGRNARIPDRDFKAHFGRPHRFAMRQVITTTQIVPNQTQFVYGGYTFIILDPWPDDWALTDDCYIDYADDEYVLIDVAHPGIQITLSIVAG